VTALSLTNGTMAIRPIIPVLISFIFLGCIGHSEKSNSSKASSNRIPIIDYEYISSYPHNTTSYTEGLLIHNGKLFESTGSPSELTQTRSLFGIVDLKTGIIDTKVELDKAKYFGEGIAFLNGKIFQLTYKTKVGFVYDAISYKKLAEFTFPSDEGWGLTSDGKSLIMSDGTNILTYLDPNTFQAIKTISVTASGYLINNLKLNELEYIKGNIYANIWTTNVIAKIDLVQGRVIGKLELNSLAYAARKESLGSLEMNGIAYDSISDRVFVTGKLWPKIYQIKLSH
jgi:glutamine cyclotransferase